MKLVGQVTSGLGDYARWIERFSDAYARAAGMALHPGTLNVRLAEPFDLPPDCQRLEPADYGGAVGVSLVPCRILGHAAVVLRTDANRDGTGPHARTIVEVATDVHLRAAHGLRDGDTVTIELDSPRRP